MIWLCWAHGWNEISRFKPLIWINSIGSESHSWPVSPCEMSFFWIEWLHSYRRWWRGETTKSRWWQSIRLMHTNTKQQTLMIVTYTQILTQPKCSFTPTISLFISFHFISIRAFYVHSCLSHLLCIWMLSIKFLIFSTLHGLKYSMGFVIEMVHLLELLLTL